MARTNRVRSLDHVRRLDFLDTTTRIDSHIPIMFPIDNTNSHLCSASIFPETHTARHGWLVKLFDFDVVVNTHCKTLQISSRTGKSPMAIKPIASRRAEGRIRPRAQFQANSQVLSRGFSASVLLTKVPFLLSHPESSSRHAYHT